MIRPPEAYHDSWTYELVIFDVQGKIMSAAAILPLLRDLYSKHPEMRSLEPWELQSCPLACGNSPPQRS